MAPRAAVRAPGALFDRVVNVAGMRAIEATAGPEAELMRRAGSALAVAVRRQLGPLRGRSVVALVGPGNNGGDALIMARALTQAGAAVTCWAPRDRADDPLVGSARRSGVRWRLWAGDARPLRRDVAVAATVVDGLLGIGSTPPLRGPIAEMLAALPAGDGQPRLAIDAPSGVDADTGEADAHAFRATATLATGPIKLGTLLHPGIEYAGTVEALDIGLAATATASDAPRLVAELVVRTLVPTRPPAAHKGTFGTVLIVGGSSSYRGAPALAALAAQGAGAGLVTVVSVDVVVQASAPVAPAATFRVLEANSDGCIGASAEAIAALGKPSAVLVGPGLGRSTESDALARELATDALRDTPMVIDADGLNALADDPDRIDSLGANRILTPHPGEMRQLLALDQTPAGAGLMDRAHELATRSGAVVVAKGSPTFVADPNQMHILAQPNPALAAAGSGDVLGGTIASLAARGIAPADAARLGVWLHARAAELAADGRIAGVQVEAIASRIADALLGLVGSGADAA